jgi:glycosyltransferase involved in cell wall biosynthesis
VKVLFIHNKYKQYGGEDVVVELETSILAENGHEVRTIFFDNDTINKPISKFRIAINSFYSFASARSIAKAIKDFKPDIIHIHNLFFIASPSILYVASKHKIPVVLTLHNYRLICANSLLLRNDNVCELCVHKTFPLAGIRYKCYRNSVIESALVTAITGFHKLSGTWKNKVTAFITLNEFSRSKLLYSSLNIPAEKMITKPNFVPDPGEGNQQREDFFLFAGRIVKEKGVHILLKSFAAMPEQKIVIAGDGPEKVSLEKEFATYQNICFIGQMNKMQVRDHMRRCKALICPSIWYEGAPLTIIEAFATGTPVIASRLGSMNESISDGYNGLHFIAGDPDDLKHKIDLFIKETETSKMFYKNARQTYLEKYHPDIHYKAIIDIYIKVMAEKNEKQA